ncbi:MAG: HNH endonuclease, partial [Anaerolineae bacterium]|nr:HNH endonuclease [Anaerolineae bacterium]
EAMLQERRTVGRSRLGELTAFLRHYLAYHSGVLCNEEHVYSRFRDRGETLDTDAFAEEISILKRFAGYYNRLLRPDHEPDEEIRQKLYRLNLLEISTAYPFLLFAYDSLDTHKINRADFVEGLTLLENYLVRRILARETTNYLNKVFPILSRDVQVNQFGETLRQALLTKNYPTDVRIRQAVETVKLYSSSGRPRLTLILETINRHLSMGTGAFTQLDGAATIEHIMPQNPSDEWKQAIGDSLMQDYELLHTLGNLTLVTQEWNSALSNAPFSEKKAKLKRHGLLLNTLYFTNAPDNWDGEAIRDRAAYLAEQIVAIWPSLGDVAEPKGWQERPKALTILGDTYEVKSWRDVVYRTAECVLQLSDDFEAVTTEVSTYFSHEPFQGKCRQLSNGWWIYVNLSSDSVKRICEILLERARIPEEEFELEFW